MSGIRKILIALFAVVCVGGIVYALYPILAGWQIERRYTAEAESFLCHTLPAAPSYADDAAESGAEAAPPPYQELRRAMREYNERIYAEGQSGLCDAWSYQTPSFDLSAYGVEDEIVGVIHIPALDVELPIYLGASDENMARGAVHLSQTSLPIGGENTNAVIAAHRGWYDAAFFRYIDRLGVGDRITITNLWETLTYEVAAIQIIDPADIDEILIRPGRDMVTLLSCHPYASGGRQRYVVYCERVGAGK